MLLHNIMHSFLNEKKAKILEYFQFTELKVFERRKDRKMRRNVKMNLKKNL